MVRVAVLGCGYMGIKIAGVMAYHGHRVKIYDSNLEALNSTYERIEDDKKELRNEGLLLHKNFVGQILCLSRLEETVRDAEFIFEAVVEDLEVKRELFEKASQYCSSDAIIASNSLQFNITDISEKASYKERTLGVRFLYPVFYIPEVEITLGDYTSIMTIDAVKKFLERMGKTIFFRSGKEPLLLTEQQREVRRQAQVDLLRQRQGLGGAMQYSIPELATTGSDLPLDDNQGLLNDHERECAICMDRIRDCVLCPCHHMCTCVECAKLLLNRCDGCPICRKDIIEIIRVYHS